MEWKPNLCKMFLETDWSNVVKKIQRQQPQCHACLNGTFEQDSTAEF